MTWKEGTPADNMICIVNPPSLDLVVCRPGCMGSLFSNPDFLRPDWLFSCPDFNLPEAPLFKFPSTAAQPDSSSEDSGLLGVSTPIVVEERLYRNGIDRLNDNEVVLLVKEIFLRYSYYRLPPCCWLFHGFLSSFNLHLILLRVGFAL